MKKHGTISLKAKELRLVKAAIPIQVWRVNGPRRKPLLSRAASRMCRLRTTSFAGKLNLGVGQHFVAEISAQVLGCAETNLSASKILRKLLFHVEQPEKPRHVSGFKLYQHVDVASRTEV